MENNYFPQWLTLFGVFHWLLHITFSTGLMTITSSTTFLVSYIKYNTRNNKSWDAQIRSKNVKRNVNEDNSNVKKSIDKTLVEFYLEGIDGSVSFGLVYSRFMLYNLNVSSVYISHCHAASDDILYNILLSFLRSSWSPFRNEESCNAIWKKASWLFNGRTLKNYS